MQVVEGIGKKRLKALIAVALIVGTAGVVSAATARPPCQREVVAGNLDGDAQFVARDVIVYGAGMFYGNPIVARVEGTISESAWYSVRLPGVTAFDQLRVVGRGAVVGAYFLEEGRLHFYADLLPGALSGAVEVFYVAGSASWSHHYELDLERLELALIGRVDWNARVMFRNVDLLFVSGTLHTVSSGWGGEAPSAMMAGGGFGLFDFSSRVTSPETDSLAAFSVPSSTDTGIYVVHRAANVDLPGSNGHGLKTCKPSSFYLRIHASPVEATEVVVAADSAIDALNASGVASSHAPAGLPFVIELVNRGALPWMAGKADIYRDGILAGADNLAYTARNGTAKIAMGWAYDVRVTRTLEKMGATAYHNYTIQNLDEMPFTVELESAASSGVVDTGPFTRDGILLKARGVIQPGQVVRLFWTGPA